MIELERYEMFEVPLEMRRREFFGLIGGGIAVLALEPEQQDVSGWVKLGEDGAITAVTGKVEIGQNIRTSLSQAVAEELRVPISAVRPVMGDTDPDMKYLVVVCAECKTHVAVLDSDEVYHFFNVVPSS